MMKGLNVEVNVGPVLKQYVEHCLGMDVVEVGNGWILTDIIIPYLELRPYKQLDLFDDRLAIKDEKDSVIKIQMPLISRDVYNWKSRKVIKLNGYYRTEVSAEGQAMVRRHLKKIMRQAFRTYMDGYTAAWEELDKKRIKSGIINFFLEYEISFEEKDISAYARDWLRYRNKKYDGRISPILF